MPLTATTKPLTPLGQLLFLRRLEERGHVYAGTVPAAVKARRRARNRVARASRKANR